MKETFPIIHSIKINTLPGMCVWWKAGMIQTQDDKGFIVGSWVFSRPMLPIIFWIQLFTNSICQLYCKHLSEYAESRGLQRWKRQSGLQGGIDIRSDPRESEQFLEKSITSQRGDRECFRDTDVFPGGAVQNYLSSSDLAGDWYLIFPEKK